MAHKRRNQEGQHPVVEISHEEYCTVGLILVVTVGATFGWLVALLLEVRSFGDLSTNVAAGAGGAVMIGGVANPVSLLEGLAANALLVAGLGALMFIAVANFVRSRA